MDKIHYTNIKNLIDADNIKSFKDYLTAHQIDINDNFSSNPKKLDTIIYYCVKKNNINFVKELFTYPDIKVNIANSDGLTPLLHAITYKKSEIFDILISHPAPGLNIESSRLHAMSRAAQARNLEMVKKIADHSENNWDLLGNTPFFYAFSNKQTEMGLFIINHPNFDPYIKASHTYPLNYVDHYKKAVDAIMNLDKFNPNTLVDVFDIHGKKSHQEPLWWKSLHFLSSISSANTLEKNILNHPKVDINAKNSLGLTLIQEYTDASNHITFDVLINNKKIDINVLNEKNQTMLETLILNHKYHQNSEFSLKKDKNKVEKLLSKIVKEDSVIYYGKRVQSLDTESPLKEFALSTLSYYKLSKEVAEKNIPSKAKIKI